MFKVRVYSFQMISQTLMIHAFNFLRSLRCRLYSWCNFVCTLLSLVNIENKALAFVSEVTNLFSDDTKHKQRLTVYGKIMDYICQSIAQKQLANFKVNWLPKYQPVYNWSEVVHNDSKICCLILELSTNMSRFYCTGIVRFLMLFELPCMQLKHDFP